MTKQADNGNGKSGTQKRKQNKRIQMMNEDKVSRALKTLSRLPLLALLHTSEPKLEEMKEAQDDWNTTE